MANGQERVYGVDGIRAFAALSVFFAHLLGPVLPDMLRILPLNLGSSVEFTQYIFTGHPAVIIFFVVSGFCIHYPHVNRSLPVVPFWAARFIRIMIPVAIAIGIAKLVGISDFNFQDGYILWSIVCELFYYALYPVFILAARFVPFRWQFYMAFVISCVLAMVLGTDQYGSAHRYGPYLNWLVALPSWLAGCVLAEQVVAGQYHSAGDNIYLWRIAIVLSASILYWLTMNTPWGYYLTMNAFSLLVFFWLSAEILAARNGHRSFFERIGGWSYSIYLFHVIFFTLLSKVVLHLEMLHMVWWQVRLLVISVALGLCYLAYRLVEKPSHRLARILYSKLQQRFNPYSTPAYGDQNAWKHEASR